jgi:hypothetical protein
MHKTLNNGHVLKTWKEQKRKNPLGKDCGVEDLNVQTQTKQNKYKGKKK